MWCDIWHTMFSSAIPFLLPDLWPGLISVSTLVSSDFFCGALGLLFLFAVFTLGTEQAQSVLILTWYQGRAGNQALLRCASSPQGRNLCEEITSLHSSSWGAELCAGPAGCGQTASGTSQHLPFQKPGCVSVCRRCWARFVKSSCLRCVAVRQEDLQRLFLAAGLMNKWRDEQAQRKSRCSWGVLSHTRNSKYVHVHKKQSQGG